MKITLLLIIAMLGAALATTAQITINRSDLGNLVGKQVIRANDSTNLNLLSLGSAGANQNWDLTGIGNDYMDSMSFINPTGISFTNNFPTATLAVNQQGMIVYLYDNNSVLDILGVRGVFMAPDTLIGPFTPPQKQMTFPFTYNTTFSGQTKRVVQFPYSSIPMVDSIKLIGHISYTSLIDGWGNVTTPSGTFPSLRRKYTSYETDSMFVHTPWMGWQSYDTPTIDTSIEYSWSSQHIPFIADIVTDWNGSIKSANYLVSTTMGFITPSTNTVTIDMSANISVASNVTWTATSNEPWLTVSPDTATQDTATLTFTATANTTNTTRTATITISAGGVSSQTITITQAAWAGTGFATVSKADFVIYPNPATSSFSINTQSLTKVQIYKENGTLVLSKQVNGKESISTNNLTKGMYVVKIITDNAVTTKTLIVE